MFEKQHQLNAKSAYICGYKTGLTGQIDAAADSDLSLSESLSVAWVDGWLDGSDATEKQCLDAANG